MNDIVENQTAKANSKDTLGAAVQKAVRTEENANPKGIYPVECWGPKPEHKKEYLELREKAALLVSKGKVSEANKILKHMETMTELKWADVVNNLVTTAGKNDALDKYLAGSAYTATWYIGLVNGASPTFAVGDTMASHAGWTENENYSEGARQTAAFSSASAGSKTLSSVLSYSIDTDSQTISGCFLVTNSTKGGTTGVLYSCGAFTGGNKSVDDGDTLTVGYTASL